MKRLLQDSSALSSVRAGGDTFQRVALGKASLWRSGLHRFSLSFRLSVAATNHHGLPEITFLPSKKKAMDVMVWAG